MHIVLVACSFPETENTFKWMTESCPDLQKGALLTLDLDAPGVREPQWKLPVAWHRLGDSTWYSFYSVSFVYWNGNLLPCT